MLSPHETIAASESVPFQLFHQIGTTPEQLHGARSGVLRKQAEEGQIGIQHPTRQPIGQASVERFEHRLFNRPPVVAIDQVRARQRGHIVNGLGCEEVAVEIGVEEVPLLTLQESRIRVMQLQLRVQSKGPPVQFRWRDGRADKTGWSCLVQLYSRKVRPSAL